MLNRIYISIVIVVDMHHLGYLGREACVNMNILKRLDITNEVEN